MRLKRYGSLLNQSLRQATSTVQLRQSCRHVSGSSAQDIAIIGGGITGLTTAYYLSKGVNPPKITIYESSKRVGGWLNSKNVDVTGGRVLFEQGPRSLRPAMPRGTHAAALLEELGLADDIIYVPKTSTAARNRWLYYPDHLVRVPHPSQGLPAILQTILLEDAFKGYKWDLAKEIWTDKRDESIQDESIGEFLSRRINSQIVDKAVSAVYHGIYAGDVWRLSARSLMSEMWYAEGKYGSVAAGMGMMREENIIRKDDADLMLYLLKSNGPSDALREKLQKTSVITLKRGLQQMTEGMEGLLKMAGNVTFKTETPVERIAIDSESQRIKLTSTTSDPPQSYDQVISTIFSKSFSNLCLSPTNQPLLPSLSATTAVTVAVVNLYYPNPSLLPVEGFGYLIPQAVPFSENPELALGVVFDSDITHSQDTAPGTKLTVMLGGHWWDGWTALPDEKRCVEMAKSVLKRHMGITAEPEASHVGIQKNCIPQYTVGHVQRLKEAHYALLRNFGGRVKVAGNSYTGVGVNDCLMAALNVAESVKSSEWTEKSGLERFERDDLKFVPMEGYAMG